MPRTASGSLFLLFGLLACGEGEAPSLQLAEESPTSVGGAADEAFTGNAIAAPGGSDLHLYTRREKRVPGNPEWIAHVDVNGDGTLEVLAAANSPGGLLLWRTEEGDPEHIPFDDFPLRPVALGSTVVAASRATQSVSFMDLSIPGQPREVSKHVMDDVPMVMTSGVLDEQRGLELFVAGRRGSLSRSNHDMQWSSQQFDGSLPRCAAVLGPKLGLVVGYQGTDSLEVFVAGAGDQLEWRTRYALPGTARDLLPLDVNGDGDLELLVVGADQSGWILGLGGLDPFEEGAEVVSFSTTAIPMRLLALPQVGAGTWAVLAGKSVAIEIWSWVDGAASRQSFSYAGQTPADFLTHDGNRDGVPDFWVANRDAHRVSLMLMGQSQPIDPQIVRVGAFPNDIATGDLDGDGLPEAFVINAKDNDISVLARHSGPGLKAYKRVKTGRSPRGVRSADIDSDGSADLLWLERVFEGTSLNVRLGDGQLGLAAPLEFEPFPMGIGCREFVLARFPGEERPVVVAADQDGRKLLWTRPVVDSPGHVSFEKIAELALPGTPRSLATLNVQGSPRALMVAMNLVPDRSRVQLYRPEFDEQDVLHWQLHAEMDLPGSVLDIDMGDVDGDGVDDLLYLASDREGVVHGRVTPVLVKGAKLIPQAPLVADLLPQCVLAEDFDGDGRAEFFVANLDSHNVNAWTTDLVGETLNFRRLDDVGAGAGCIALGSMDFEGDGDMDLLVVDSANDGVSLILNLLPSPVELAK